eukprot:TRINITY_DN31680_c0_g1_i1.p1 TRINITY_DN31680_c0_g1~~TRINITY_DN31680_c0_g1_i1.p1  ORF type:complete len:612 (-),score=93.05 TRINITY_DN31680_c0_g1_i1:78-1709(-)
MVDDSCKHHGVEFAGNRIDGDIGTFTVLPEQKTVHYQRRNSVFALHDPSSLSWETLLKSGLWLHVTGITPLISKAARTSWDNAVKRAVMAGIPLSLDLNHRKQLGSLEELWAIVSPHVQHFELVILSLEQLNGLAAFQLVGRHVQSSVDDKCGDETVLDMMRALQSLWHCKRIALCRKTRDSAGVQRRWSLLTCLEPSGTISFHSTGSIPVWHVPKDECGGGSAWAAGLIHALCICPASEEVKDALRRADLLSALCQETEGDFSSVTSGEFHAALQRFAGKEASLPGTEPIPRLPAMTFPALAIPNQQTTRIALGKTLSGLKQAGVLAILRAKGSPEVAIERGIELAALGCAAMEVTLDSSDWQAVLSGLRQRLPSHVLLGVGTVMDDTVSQVPLAKALGATFALSPIDPIGFVEECHRHGVLAIPSAFTSNECWALHRRGVKLIKLFHAGLASPAILKSMLDVSPLGANLNILPSGGVSPSNASKWWDAGAAVIGMGSNLVGKDIATQPGTPEHDAAVAEWMSSGRQTAEKLCREVAERFQK